MDKKINQYGALRLPLLRRPGSGIMMLLCTSLVMLVVLSVVVGLIGLHHPIDTRMLRISTVMQDLMVFILPAIVAAIIATRLPASLLTIDVKPRVRSTMMALLVLVASIPAMEMLINLNMSMHLPASLSGVEAALREMETTAAGTVNLMMGGNSVMDLIMSILLIGVLTGVAEELFFRGALQNMLFSTSMKKHVAVWLTAFIFSVVHFQFFGFVPRLLLGAYLGYLIWWTGSVWVPVMAHALNNSIAVATTWATGKSESFEEAERAIAEITASDMLTVGLSIACTVVGLIILRRVAAKECRQ